MAERLFSMNFSKEEDGSINVNTEFHKEISGRELLPTLKTALHGMLQSTVKVAQNFGMSEEEATDYLFAVDPVKSNATPETSNA